MTAFATTFIDAQGRRRRYIFEARDETAVRTLLRARSLWPVRVEPVRPGRGLAQLKIPNRDLVALLHQLELQLRAGVTADEALRQLAEDAPPGAVRTVLDHVHGEVAQGQPIHVSCRFFGRIFPAHVASVIAAGEISARLPEALRGLAAHLTRIEDLRRTARRAMIYPLVVLTATAGLVAFLLGGVVPRFAEIFTSLHLALPPLTVGLIRTSEIVREHPGVLIAIAGLLVGGGFAAARSPRLRALRDHGLLRVPLLGDTLAQLATARFAAHGRLLHDAGIPLLDALATGAELTGNAVLAGNLLAAREAVARGQPLYRSLPPGHGFPPFVIPALKAGETTGQLSAALHHIEDYAAERAREHLATGLALLEPVLLGILAAVVGAIAFSFFLPLLSLLGGVNAH